MPAHPASDRYSGVSIALHWLMAAVIVIAFALALGTDAFPRDWKPVVVEVHKALGLAVLGLLALRFAWRLMNPPPPLAEVTPLVQRASQLGHLGLYVLMVAVPVIGIVYTFWRGQPLHLGLFDVASPFAADRPTARQYREIHEFAAYALIGLAGLHAAAALWHHYIRRDGVLRRMLPA
jgi:cytochrome b561